MKFLLFLALGLVHVPLSYAQGSFLIVSDFDDTIKITGAHKKWVSFSNTIIGKPPIAGMAELSRDWVASSGRMWNVVSGSPRFLRNIIEDFFENFRIPLGSLTLRNIIQESDTQKYKVRAIREMIKTSQLPVVLVGDDTEKDPAAYHELKSEFGDKIASIYIHQVNPKRPVLPASARGYVSPAELVLREMRAQRLSDLTLGRVLLEISGKPLKQLMPSYYYCPKDYEIDRALLASVNATLYDAVLRHELAVSAYCQNLH